MKSYDIIVVGAGHAGLEAALSASRMGCKTLLITLTVKTIGFLSCNPAIGGIGKGQLVKEIDALGGEMAKAADYSSIQCRILNASKGSAVWSSRAQVDRKKYESYVKKTIKSQKRLNVLEAEVSDFIIKKNKISGVRLKGDGVIHAKAVIVTPGTFLNGLIHIGMRSFEGGRIEERKASKDLSKALKSLGFSVFRFKTGTCARLDGKTISFSLLKEQKGDKDPQPFSFSSKNLKNKKQLSCYITYTNEATHRIIHENLKRSPLYSGKIKGRPVRYCPSLEDKVVKFSHHPRHQVFLEPEGLNTNEYYPNGLSTSLPEKVQDRFIRSVPGLENVKINRYGYGIEHDVIDSTQLMPTLESKFIKGLYVAGQINGTTGYEEAAAQGLVAGINAALSVKNKKPLIFERSESYIGVLIDDLVTKGTEEPYRMFTSRCEYRLVLREDNADSRLRKVGYDLGLVKKKEYDKTAAKQKKIKSAIYYLKKTKVKGKALFELLKRPGVTIDKLKNEGLLRLKLPRHLIKTIESEIKYSGYIKRQFLEIKRFKNLERVKIPPTIDFDKIPSLSNEIREKLKKFKPVTLGQASRISGVTPVAISVLLVYLKKRT